MRSEIWLSKRLFRVDIKLCPSARSILTVILYTSLTSKHLIIPCLAFHASPIIGPDPKAQPPINDESLFSNTSDDQYKPQNKTLVKVCRFRQGHESITFLINDENKTMNRHLLLWQCRGICPAHPRTSQSKVCKAYVGWMKLNNIDINPPCRLPLDRLLFCSLQRWVAGLRLSQWCCAGFMESRA